ncbi:TetR/AcrR family transcriptional regulator [Streptomyces sp. M19]
MEAFAGPLFDEMPVGDEDGARTSRLIVTILSDPAEEARSWTGAAVDSVRERYFAAFARVMPGLSRRSCGSGCGDLRRDGRRPPPGPPAALPGCASPVAGEAARRWAITFLTAAMSAPPVRP